ncbi:MAG: hypothetical protein M0005_01435 [Actinomycetota bacterium]|jgi:hypothetical protein|nr:hypothetical protein [Actinomycetota bacterium]
MYPNPELVMAQARAHMADMTSHARTAPALAPSRPALHQRLGWLLVELGLRLAMSGSPSRRRVARRGVARLGAVRRGVRRRYLARQVAP